MRSLLLVLLIVPFSGCITEEAVPDWVKDQGWDDYLDAARLIKDSPHTLALGEANLPTSPGQTSDSIDSFRVFFRIKMDDGQIQNRPHNGSVDFSLGKHDWTVTFTEAEFTRQGEESVEGTTNQWGEKNWDEYSFTGTIDYPAAEAGYYPLRAELNMGDKHVATERLDVYLMEGGQVVEAGEPKGFMGVPNGTQMVINAFTSRCNAYITIASPVCEYHPDEDTLEGFGYTVAASMEVSYQIHLAQDPCTASYRIKPSSGDRDWLLHDEGTLQMTPDNRIVTIEPIPEGAVFRISVQDNAVVGFMPGGAYYAPFVESMVFTSESSPGYVGTFEFRDASGKLLPIAPMIESEYQYDYSYYDDTANSTVAERRSVWYNGTPQPPTHVWSSCGAVSMIIGGGAGDHNPTIAGRVTLADGREFPFEWQG